MTSHRTLVLAIATIKGSGLDKNEQLAQAVTDAVLVQMENEDEERMHRRFADRRNRVRAQMKGVFPLRVSNMELVPVNGQVIPDYEYGDVEHEERFRPE